VRDSACDVGPGGAALIEQLLGDIVEGQHMPSFVGHDLDREGACLARSARFHDALAHMAVEQRVEFGRDRCERLIDRHARAACEHNPRRAVHQPHASLAIDREDAGRHARQHRLGQRAPPLERAGLLFEADRHAVERVGERRDLILGTRIGHTRGKVARGHATCGIDQLTNRPHEPIRHIQRDPYRDGDDQQRDEQQRGIELKLQTPRSIDQRAIFDQNCACALKFVPEGRIYPRRVKIIVGADGKFRQRADAVRALHDDGRLARAQRPDHRGRDEFADLAIIGIDQQE